MKLPFQAPRDENEGPELLEPSAKKQTIIS